MNLSDLSFHRQGGWQNQFSRLQRWHARVKQLKDGVSADELDVLYAFFQNCFSLKDWLKNAKVITSSQLNSFFNSHPELKFCRDLSNGTKHYNLTSWSLDPNFFICREYVPQGSDNIHPSACSRPMICAGGMQRNMFELADRCVELWIRFIGDHGLLEAGPSGTE